MAVPISGAMRIFDHRLIRDSDLRADDRTNQHICRATEVRHPQGSDIHSDGEQRDQQSHT